ncbi:hypothetical protein F4824DRAFT_499646 [Ustulina deusta]|nr:hypothetical protein F4824DRAFT_499646 [Ustulina deusta]
MHLFRRRLGARKKTPTGDTRKVDSNPPPSYEDSQDASLREVLQGARAVLPLLWPSTSESSSSSLSSSPTTFASSPTKPANKCQNIAPDTELGTRKNGRDPENRKPSLNGPEDAIIEVLSALAMAPCAGHPFLDRIRQFSDAYFTPYTASEGSPASPPQAEGAPVQEQQRRALQNIPAPRESVALVLCARVLEAYYAGLGHVDSATDVEMIPYDTPSKVSPGCRQGEKKAGSSRDAEEPPSSLPRMKTRVTHIAACVAEGCACIDFDEAIPGRTQPKADIDRTPRCGCGHPRTSHSSAAAGISRLLRRYTNWDSASYSALGHRSSDGARKRRVVEIRACGASCPCRDYDKGRRTGRCARCGHYDGAHFPIDVAQEKQARETRKLDKRRKRKGDGGRSNSTGTDLAQKKAEWELSWILVENAYLLLNQITPLPQDGNC